MKQMLYLLITVLTLLCLAACNPLDSDYGTKSEPQQAAKSSSPALEDIPRPEILSMDRVMSQFVDISLYDEENYSAVYLGNKFKWDVAFAGDRLSVPTKLSALTKAGWTLSDSGEYDEDSPVFAGEQVEVVFQKESGEKLTATFYNHKNSSVKLKKCTLVKLYMKNNFYKNPQKFSSFYVNGINNRMAITDIIDTLGMPSHFYAVSKHSYYLDYFISEKDRRNGITVYVDTEDDAVTAIEVSSYK